LLLAATADNMSDISFISDGTGHGVYITASGTYTFDNWTFSGYGANDTTDAAVYNNSGGSVTINVSGGDSPTVRNGTSASTTVNNPRTYTVSGVETNSEVRIYNADTDAFLDGIENTTGQVQVVAIATGGTGYSVSDVLTVSGGTGTAATLTVTSVSGGVVTGVSITNAGDYSVNPTNPVSVTGGTGSNATFRLTISGEFSYAYNYVSDIPIYVVVFHLNYKDLRLVNRTLINSNKTDTVQQVFDRNYSNS